MGTLLTIVLVLLIIVLGVPVLLWSLILIAGILGVRKISKLTPEQTEELTTKLDALKKKVDEAKSKIEE